MRIDDDSDSSFSCGPTPPNPNNDNDTSCILRLSPDALQRDLLPGSAAPWAPRAPPAAGLRNLVYDQAYAEPQVAPPVPPSLDDVISGGEAGGMGAGRLWFCGSCTFAADFDV